MWDLSDTQNNRRLRTMNLKAEWVFFPSRLRMYSADTFSIKWVPMSVEFLLMEILQT